MKRIGIALATLAALLAGGPAAATTYLFDQGGFSEGATLTGQFEATDLDSNGQLSSFRGEISGFTLSFSGNSLIAAFTLTLDNLFVLVADLDGSGEIGDGLTGDVEGVGADDGLFRYLAGPGPVDLCGIGTHCAVLEGPGFAADFSMEPISFRVVPIPAALPLFVFALLSLAGMRRNR